MKLPIYLDNNATTRVDPRVIEEMLPCFLEDYGNPASTSHPYGWKARELVDHSRRQIAGLAGCNAEDVIFTSGATESINLILKGIARNTSWADVHIVTCVTEHSAVLDTCSYLESLGARVTRLGVDFEGNLALDELRQALRQKPTLVSLMHANNEIGVIHPIETISGMCQKSGVPLHVDAAQTFGKIAIQFNQWHVDFLSVSGHKLYAPKGVGLLIIRRQVPPLRLTPLLHGGGHERGFRSGTLNVPGIVALGKASEICSLEMDSESARIRKLRDTLQSQLLERIRGLLVNGSLRNRLSGNLNISIPGLQGQYLLPALRGQLCVSSGSACTSALPKPSHVLAALGQTDDLAHSSLRFGIGRFNTVEEIDHAASILPEIVDRLRKENGPL